jgi:penicillin amidase
MGADPDPRACEERPMPNPTTARPEDCLAQTSGTLTIRGLDAAVRIVRDRWGIPHIDATTRRDAFFAQGFCMGQDRMFQIELYRRMARGTSAAMLNKGLLARDIQNRRLGFGRHADREWDAQTPAAREVLQAYADGINAAIATQPVPYEFRVLEHTIEPWTPADSLAVIKMVNANAQWAGKLKNGKVAATLGVEALQAMIPDVPVGAAVITPPGGRWVDEDHPFARDIESAMGIPDGVIASGGGSNCWVIHGSRTDTGAPIVCGDPHLAIGVPGQWYVVHMRCPEFTAAGPCNPCYPGPVFYGHNTHVAWTMTHAQGDRWDLYRERIRRGDAGPEALYRDRWEPLTRREEHVAVRGADDATAVIWETRHGVVLSGDPTRDDEVLAARWGLSEPAHDMDAMLAALTARTAAEAREAFRTYDSISGNYCFADRDGNIGYQYVGRIPKRPAWVIPVPGWDGEHEWDGDVPKDELPIADNPANGFIVTANNRTTTPDYPHYLTYSQTPFRANRLRELMDATEVFRLDEMPVLQSDQTSHHARAMTALFTSFEATNADARAMQRVLAGWDAHLAPDSAAALVYDEACQRLVASTVHTYYAAVPGMPPWALGDDRRILFEQTRANSPLMLGAFPSWAAAAEQALAEAALRLRSTYGDDPSRWRWADRHRMAWNHNLGRDPELAQTFNLPAIGLGGDGFTPFNTQVAYGAASDHGVSFRQVLDLRDLNAARICIPPGNSGQPGSPHYGDNLERWQRVEYHPLFVEWSDIEANAEAELTLVPA